MTRTHFRDVTVEIGSGSDWGREIIATVEFTATAIIPATWDDPAEGGEVEALNVIDLFIPEVAGRKGEYGQEISGKPRIDLDCPAWLAAMILENIDTGALLESVDFDDDYGDYERD